MNNNPTSEVKEYEIPGYTAYSYGAEIPNFDVVEFDELITRLQTKTTNAFNALEIIRQCSINMANIIGNNEGKLSNQWSEIAETIAKIRNKYEERSLSFINMLSSYKKKTLENEADWAKDINRSSELLNNVNEKLSKI